jgi:hypothetical protein
MLLGQI